MMKHFVPVLWQRCAPRPPELWQTAPPWSSQRIPRLWHTRRLGSSRRPPCRRCRGQTGPDLTKMHGYWRRCRRYIVPVLRIHDILVWIRIRGSTPLTNGSGSFYFHHWPSRCQQKIFFFKQVFFCILLFKGTFTSFFKDKKSKISHKTVEIKVFLTILA